MILMVQSDIKPDWSAVDSHYLAQADPFDLLPNPAVKQLSLPLRASQVLSFRLCANPTVKKARQDETGKRRHSNRVPLVREDQQLAWLQARAEASGFRILRATISQQQQQIGWQKGNKRPITLYSIQFDGHLQVVHPDEMLKAIRTGVGPAKAFGCGLLSLAPV
jgi:CRISPR system Cascade subunit CasE